MNATTINLTACIAAVQKEQEDLTGDAASELQGITDKTINGLREALRGERRPTLRDENRHRLVTIRAELLAEEWAATYKRVKFDAEELL